MYRVMIVDDEFYIRKSIVNRIDWKAYGMEVAGEAVQISLSLKEHGVIYFELQPVKTAGDRGYDYNRVMQYDQD